VTAVIGVPWLANSLGLPGLPELPERADVVVIGGGLAGAAATAMLAAKGTDVVLLESRPDVGLGASGRHLGHVTTGLIEHPYRLVHAMGSEKAGQLLAFSAQNHALLQEWTAFEPSGGLWCALDQREQPQIAMSAESLVELGIAVEELRAETVNERIGAQGLGPGMWLPGDGIVDPANVVRDLVARAPERAYVNCAVTAVTEDEAGAVVHVGGRTIGAELVVFAANAWCPTIDAVFDGKITPIREQALRFAPSDVEVRAGRAGYGYTVWRQAPDGALLVGGCRWATPHMEVGETDEDRVVDRIQRKIEGFARVHFPASTATEITHRWSWIVSTTCDGLPIIGPLPGSARMIACAGFCGNEAGLGVRAAQAVVDGILEGRTDGVPAFLAASRFV